MPKLRKYKIPTPPHPMEEKPKEPGTLRRTYWVEDGRIICWQEVADHEGTLHAFDRVDEDFSPDGEIVDVTCYSWGGQK